MTALALILGSFAPSVVSDFSMRVLITVLLAVKTITAYDAVIFSSEQKIEDDYPSIENLLSTASPESPLVFIVNPDFTLGQFSREARAYSVDKTLRGLPATVKSKKYHVSRYLEDFVLVLNAVKVTSAEEFTKGNATYVVAGEEWTSMQSLAKTVLSGLGDSYTAVITATDAVATDKARTKRVITSEMDETTGSPSAANGPEIDMPVNLPPYNRTEYPDVRPDASKLGSCMLYSEGINIVVRNAKKEFVSIPVRSLTNTTSWSYAAGDVNCVNSTAGPFEFTVRLKLKGDVTDNAEKVKISSGSPIEFKLVFNGTSGGFWMLTDVVANNVAVQDNGKGFISGSAKADTKVISRPSVNNVGFQSVAGFALGCGDSQAAFFKTNQDDVLIGISLHNTEVQPFGVSPDKKTSQMYFSRQVEDCVGTFSVGSWMGIISILVMLGGLMFGYLMLQSVQTMDRFDDPKHKQIVINVRE
ncbi:unnamed protein product [Cylicocyclus nassatus]|uniref:V-type proton ATPase subunit S1/VOA1 transmembrane domain-containing protein n=1 Tax=Cylicocyclus nassatus TaxID=53992 RepID=A0AA36H5D6_CYLNA|nr:unnamed protein product [Cylicocyclus nassatus]